MSSSTFVPSPRYEKGLGVYEAPARSYCLRCAVVRSLAPLDTVARST
jgi:hypothetical protein